MSKVMFVDVKWNKDIVLSDEILKHLEQENVKTLVLFASVQFLKLDKALAQLEEKGILIRKTKAKRADVPVQVLGCDCYSDSYEEDVIGECDAVLYIGDGLFHPKALLLSQLGKEEIKPIIIWDPLSEKMRVLGQEEVKEIVDRLKVNLRKFVSSGKVGILVTSKPGQQHLEKALELKEKLEKDGKKAYIFIDDKIDYGHLENYPFIEVWVNTGCPRMGLDDAVNLDKPLLNMKEAVDPIGALERLERK